MAMTCQRFRGQQMSMFLMRTNKEAGELSQSRIHFDTERSTAGQIQNIVLSTHQNPEARKLHMFSL